MSNSQKIAFLDRDGVINKKSADDSYVINIDSFEFNKDIFDVLRKLAEDGYKFIVITNQRGIARKLMSEDDLGLIHDYMLDRLKKQGIEILDIFFCPHEKNECGCRKPKPGMLVEATKKHNVDVANSLLISDNMSEVEMGNNFGIGKNIYIEENNPAQFFKQY